MARDGRDTVSDESGNPGGIMQRDECAGRSRRTFLQTGAMAMLSADLGLGQSAAPNASQAARSTHPAATSVKALVFDVFGTVVDWRSSVAKEVTELSRRKGLSLDGERFADAWRAAYGPSMNRVRTGVLPWTTLDRLHRMSLDNLLVEFKVTGLSEAEIAALNRSWHRLQPWPDSVAGLTRLKARFIIAPLSNGNIALMTNMAKHAGLPWDCVLGAELARHYKPDREVYQSAADFLDLAPAEVMMVAAHLGDLKAARTVGLKTAFVTRPKEYGPSGKPDLKADGIADVSATDFNDLAAQLGA
jgi:2-haloacid dehalogenase